MKILDLSSVFIASLAWGSGSASLPAHNHAESIMRPSYSGYERVAPVVSSYGPRDPTREDYQVVTSQLRKMMTAASRGSIAVVPRTAQVSSPYQDFCESWHEEVSRIPDGHISGPMALSFLREKEATLKCQAGQPGPFLCRWLAMMKGTIGGSFDTRTAKVTSLSETVSYSGLPHEKRVTATFMLVPPAKDRTRSLSSVFETYLREQSREKVAPRVFNSIRVNQRKEELAISAGGGLDDVYAFSHCNDLTNSIWIILYLGQSKTVEYGRSVIRGFQNYLLQADFIISDSIVVSSDEEEQMERDSEKQVEIDRVNNMEFISELGLKSLCFT